MANLYKHVFDKKIAQNLLGLQTFTRDELFASLQKFLKMHDPGDQLILYRLPKNELQIIGSLPCPVVFKDDKIDKTDKIVINASKALRQHFLNFKEEKSCSNCPLASTCLMKNKLSSVEKASITDVTMLLGSLYYKRVADINDKQTISVFNAATALV